LCAGNDGNVLKKFKQTKRASNSNKYVETKDFGSRKIIGRNGKCS